MALIVKPLNGKHYLVSTAGCYISLKVFVISSFSFEHTFSCTVGPGGGGVLYKSLGGYVPLGL